MAKLISVDGSISSGMNTSAAVAQALAEVGTAPGLMQRTYENVVNNGGTAVIQGPRGVAQVVAETKDFGTPVFSVSTAEELKKTSSGNLFMTLFNIFAIVGCLLIGFPILNAIFSINFVAGVVATTVAVLFGYVVYDNRSGK